MKQELVCGDHCRQWILISSMSLIITVMSSCCNTIWGFLLILMLFRPCLKCWVVESIVDVEFQFPYLFLLLITSIQFTCFVFNATFQSTFFCSWISYLLIWMVLLLQIVDLLQQKSTSASEKQEVFFLVIFPGFINENARIVSGFMRNFHERPQNFYGWQVPSKC